MALVLVAAVMMFSEAGRRAWTQEKTATLLGRASNPVHPAGPCKTTTLAGENVAINARLQAVLVVRECVKVEAKQALAIALAKGAWGEGAQEALLASCRWSSSHRALQQANEGSEGSEWSEGLEGSHFVGWSVGGGELLVVSRGFAFSSLAGPGWGA